MKTARKILFVLIAMVAAGAGRVSADGTSVIREDRIWEYVRRNCHYWEVLQLQFDGVELCGDRQYAQLHTVGHFRVYDGYDSRVTEVYENLMTSGEDEIVLLREDHRAVYRLMEYCGELCELKVYDFNVSDGEELIMPVGYGYVSGEGLNNMFPPVRPEGCDGYPYNYKFKVISEGMEYIAGEQCRYLEFEFCGDKESFPCSWDSSYKIIEGIGPAAGKYYSGTLAMLEAYSPSTGLDSDAECYSLNRVYSNGMDVIYKARDIDWQECLDKAGIPALQSGSSQAEYYSLQGIRLEEPRPGEIVIKVEGGRSRKISF